MMMMVGVGLWPLTICSGWQPVQRFLEPADGEPQLHQPALREVHQAQRRQGGLHVRQEARCPAAESLWSA